MPPGEVGQICYKGPQVFLGYLGDEESTKKTIAFKKRTTWNQGNEAGKLQKNCGLKAVGTPELTRGS
jgi:acyl-CoA synthetase (AMP-forming)/AMP-acid ligase II